VKIFNTIVKQTNSTTASGMNPDKEYRIWSLVSQKYLVLTKNGDNTPTVDCTGTGQEQSGVISLTRNTKSAIPGEVSYHFKFRADDGTEYVLQVDKQTTPASIYLQPFTEADSTTSAFVPESFMINSGPFKALKVGNSAKCIASSKDGHLSLKSWKLDNPHPESIFVVSEID